MTAFALSILLALGALLQPAAPSGGQWTPAVAVPTFKPSLHGFRFRNSFTGNPLPPALRPLAGNAAPGNFGLCGGMSSAVADYFHARTPIAGKSRPPTSGSPLYDYLYQRQTDSLGSGLAMVSAFMRGMQAPDLGPAGTQRLTAWGLHSILTPIAAGRPVVVGQVLTRKGGVLWQNHQVLAFGYTITPDQIRIHIYDPNHPGNDRVRMDLTPTMCGVEPGWFLASALRVTEGWTCRQVIAPLGGGSGAERTAPVRAIFPMPYSQVKPPAALTEDVPVPAPASPPK